MAVIESLIKRVWFVLLMVFAIVGSGVSFASNQFMHMQMKAVTQSESVHMQHGTSNSKQHCQKQADSVHIVDEHTQCPDMLTKMADSKYCHECSQLLCQNYISWLDETSLNLNEPQNYSSISSPHLAYQAQHLAGFWQEILRPPKT